MENVTIYVNSLGQEMMQIDNGDSTITCMPKADYDTLAANSAPQG
jgi:hypothetical protein